VAVAVCVVVASGGKLERDRSAKLADTARTGPATSAFSQLVWSDDFSGRRGARPDVRKWLAVAGDWSGGDGVLEYYTPRPTNASPNGAGDLAITA